MAIQGTVAPGQALFPDGTPGGSGPVFKVPWKSRLVRGAISFLEGGRTVLTLPNNPMDVSHPARALVTNRVAKDGTIVTHMWGPDVRTVELQGITAEEWVDDLQAFRDTYRGTARNLTYVNQLTGETKTCILTDLDLRGNGPKAPATWQYRICLQESAKFTDTGGA